MIDDDKHLITKVDLIRVIEPYHNTIAGLVSCMIKVSSGLNQAGASEQGKLVFDRLDEVINHMERAAEVMRQIGADVEENDDSE